MIKSEKINGKIAKEVLDKMLETKKSAKEIVDSMSLTQITNKDEILAVIKKVCEINQKQIVMSLADLISPSMVLNPNLIIFFLEFSQLKIILHLKLKIEYS